MSYHNNILKNCFAILVLVILAGLFFLFSQPDNKLHIYFCNVGQGDAVYIRFPDQKDMLIDGGRGEMVLDCLGKAMPFYDRRIGVVMLTHPQSDHLDGLTEVLKRFKVDIFVTGPAGNNTKDYQELTSLISQKKIELKNLYSGGEIAFGDIKFRSIWPQRDWVRANLNCSQSNDCAVIASGNGSVLGIQSIGSNLNDYSEMGILSYGNFDVLFTGDGDSHIQDDILKLEKILPADNNIEVLKVPHHGSKTGLTDKFLEIYKPNLAVISVGKNSYGHPSEETLRMLSAKDIRILRTDKEGTIEIVSDGASWKIIN